MDVFLHQLCCTIGPGTTYLAVVDHFRRFCRLGQINDVYIPRDFLGRSQGHAFVTFSSEEDLKNSVKVCSCSCSDDASVVHKEREPVMKKGLQDSLQSIEDFLVIVTRIAGFFTQYRGFPGDCLEEHSASRVERRYRSGIIPYSR